MTIKQLHDITDPKTTICIGWSDYIKTLDRSSTLELAAYGRYVIESITPLDENRIEADLKTLPITE